jgi:hypothetical protein
VLAGQTLLKNDSARLLLLALLLPALLLLLLQASEENITVEQFSGAMTNLVYRCGLQEGGKETQVGSSSSSSSCNG